MVNDIKCLKRSKSGQLKQSDLQERMRTVGGLSFPIANNDEQPPTALLSLLTPPDEGWRGCSDDEGEALPGWLALEEAARSRGCLDLAWDRV